MAATVVVVAAAAELALLLGLVSPTACRLSAAGGQIQVHTQVESEWLIMNSIKKAAR